MAVLKSFVSEDPWDDVNSRYKLSPLTRTSSGKVIFNLELLDEDLSSMAYMYSLNLRDGKATPLSDSKYERSLQTIRVPIFSDNDSRVGWLYFDCNQRLREPGGALCRFADNFLCFDVDGKAQWRVKARFRDFDPQDQVIVYCVSEGGSLWLLRVSKKHSSMRLYVCGSGSSVQQCWSLWTGQFEHMFTIGETCYVLFNTEEGRKLTKFAESCRNGADITKQLAGKIQQSLLQFVNREHEPRHWQERVIEGSWNRLEYLDSICSGAKPNSVLVSVSFRTKHHKEPQAAPKVQNWALILELGLD
jgi:hypothetical protein